LDAEFAAVNLNPFKTEFPFEADEDGRLMAKQNIEQKYNRKIRFTTSRRLASRTADSDGTQFI